MARVIDTLEGIDLCDSAAIEVYWDSDLLQDLYLAPKGIARERTQEALGSEAFCERLATTAAFLQASSAAATCERMIASFEEDAGHSAGDVTLYLILGCATTTIYTAEIGGRHVSVLCVESLAGSPDTLRAYLAHEFTHWVRGRLVTHDIFESCVGERLVTEGIAENYSREVVPGLPDEAYCIVDVQTVRWVRDNQPLMHGLVGERLADASLMEPLFWMYADIEFPVRTGYVYGYDAVRHHLEEHGLAVRDILGIDWRDVLGPDGRWR